MKTYKFHVEGMHCKSCVVLTESEINALPYVEKAVSNLEETCIEVTGNFFEKSPEEIANELSVPLEPHGYKLHVHKIVEKKNFSDFKWALPIAAVFILFFVVLQKLGILNFVNASSLGFGTAFMIGIVASLSTCMAVVGGLVLSISANYAKSNNKVRPLAMFHIGRLASFFVLGGVIGLLGASFQLGIMGNFILGLLVGLILLALGINLLDVFSWTRNIIPTLPAGIGKIFQRMKSSNGIFTPILLGIATFFLPCGFTQSMQIYTLGAGSFTSGALTMLFFALGTLPVLALLSFGSQKIALSNKSGIFFKTAGVVVIFFALINILNSLAVFGIIPPVLNF
jgi:uncharacterized protein